MEPQVQYTVREMLDRMDGKIDALSKDVQDLKDARNRQSAVSALGGRAWVGLIAVLGIIVNIPAMMFYLGGGHG